VPLDKRVYFIPDVLTNEMLWIAFTTLLLTVLATWFFKAPLESHANPQQTPLHTVAPWYFLWIQGALKLGDKVFWGLVFPGLVFGFLFAMPYLDTNPSRRFADRRFALTVCFVLIAFLMAFTYWGYPTVGVATSADKEILFEMIAEEHAGVLRPIPFDQLAPGAYTTAQLEGSASEAALHVEEFTAMLEETGYGATMQAELTANPVLLRIPGGKLNWSVIPSTSPELLHALEELEHLMHNHKAELVNPFGVIVVTQDQETTKRVDVVVSWDAVNEETGEVTRQFNSNQAYVHSNSEWYER